MLREENSELLKNLSQQKSNTDQRLADQRSRAEEDYQELMGDHEALRVDNDRLKQEFEHEVSNYMTKISELEDQHNQRVTDLLK